MKITIKREQRRACPDLPNVSNLRDEGAKAKRMITNRGWRRYLAATPLRLLLLAALPAFMLTACSNDDLAPDTPGGNTPDEEGKIVFDISIAPPDDGGPQTRVATDADFKCTWEEGDEIGIFGYIGDGSFPASLEQSGNPLHNVKLTYKNQKWVGDAYWPPHIDMSSSESVFFFAYYPYDAAATAPESIAFAVKVDQSDATEGKSNYNLSDLLVSQPGGTAFKRGKTVSMLFHHTLSLVQVNVPVGTQKGSGPNGELEVSLMARAKATVNLNNGGDEAKPAATDNDPVAIRMQRVEDPANTTSYTYRALVPAQEFAKGSRIFRLNHEGRQLFIDAPLADKLTLTSGRAGKFTRSLPTSALQTVKIKPGEFQMGSPTTETGHETNETQHKVTLTKGFRMCQYEITCAQFAEFLNAVKVQGESATVSSVPAVVGTYNGHKLLVVANGNENTVMWNSSTKKWEARSGKEIFPVSSVTWYGANEYARWVGGSLPTEAQWDYACRAESTTAYTGGNDTGHGLGDYGWYSDNSLINSMFVRHNVGTKMPNKWGLYDMHGNVGEWCLDYATDDPPANYGSDDATDPVNTNRTIYHILRGGYFKSAATDCRSASRKGREDESPGDMTGFRVIFPDK